jgi:hypothetical protein
VKYADDLVLLAKEEAVLQGMIGRLIEIGRCYEMEVNVGDTKVMIISMQLSQIQIMIFFVVKGPAALRLIVQPCDEDD